MRAGATVAAAVLVLVASASVVDGQSEARGPEVTTNTNDLRVGTRLTISGDGCRRGTAGSAELLVGAALAEAPGRVVNALAVPLTPVRADGSWSITTTLGDPMPTGKQFLVARCVERPAPDRETTILTYEPLEVTTTSPPISGLSVDGYRITMDNPCRGITSSPPFSPEATAVLIGAAGEIVEAAILTPLSTETERLTVEAPRSTRPGAQDLQVTCLRHRVPEPVRIVRSPVTLSGPGSPATSTTSVPADADPTGAHALPGSPTYTG